MDELREESRPKRTKTSHSISTEDNQQVIISIDNIAKHSSHMQAALREFAKTLQTENQRDVIQQMDFIEGHMYARCMMRHREECVRAFQLAVGTWTDTAPELVCVQTWPVHHEVEPPEDVYVFHVRADAPIPLLRHILRKESECYGVSFSVEERESHQVADAVTIVGDPSAALRLTERGVRGTIGYYYPVRVTYSNGTPVFINDPDGRDVGIQVRPQCSPAGVQTDTSVAMSTTGQDGNQKPPPPPPPSSTQQGVPAGPATNRRLRRRKKVRRKEEILQCYKCQAFGNHMAKDCTAPSDTCRVCGGAHRTSQRTCTGSPKCANCGKGHAASSLQCCKRPHPRPQPRVAAPPAKQRGQSSLGVQVLQQLAHALLSMAKGGTPPPKSKHQRRHHQPPHPPEPGGQTRRVHNKA